MTYNIIPTKDTEEALKRYIVPESNEYSDMVSKYSQSNIMRPEARITVIQPSDKNILSLMYLKRVFSGGFTGIKNAFIERQKYK